MKASLTALAAFAGAYLLSLYKLDILSGCILLAAGILLFLLHFRRDGLRCHPLALFSLSWLGGCGLSAMKLSYLQVPWEKKSWIAFFLAYAGFALCYSFLSQRMAGQRAKEKVLPSGAPDHPQEENVLCGSTEQENKRQRALKNALYHVIISLSVLSFAAFLLEALILRFVPLFTVGTPHAYSYFHISGLHYLTVSYVLVPAFSVCFWLAGGLREEKRLVPVLICNALALTMAVLLVSRSQLVFSGLFAFFAFALAAPERIWQGFCLRRKKLVPGAVLFFLIFYVWITFERAHSASYLMGIFEMKDPNMPVWLAQPYIYIAHNYDNFNCLVRELPAYTFGLRSLFPIIALSGLKFLRPELAAFPLYITKTELGTLTLFYDAYYDGGLAGVLLLSGILGLVSAWLSGKMRFLRKKDAAYGILRQNPVLYVLGGQLMVYLLFSFFTTWFSNPATWYYAGLSTAGGIYIWYRMHHVSSGL